MSDPWTAASPPPAPEPPSAQWQVPERRSSTTRDLLVVAAAGLFCAAVFAVGIVVALRSGDGDGPERPDAWDPRVVDLAAFVEDERGLEFEHPVTVEFLDDAAFREEVRIDALELDEEERSGAVRDAAVLRALGLVEGDIDLLDAFSSLNQELVIAFYDPDEQRVVVRGTQLSATTRIRLVHELVHALQDQHFDLDRFEELELSSEQSAARTLVEGDADAVEDAYYDTLSPAEQRAIDADNTFDDSEIDGVPESLTYFSSAPYVFGSPLVAALDAAGGAERVDRAFDDPPTTDEQVLWPWPFARGDRATELVDVEIDGRDDEHDRDTFGALDLFMVLAERIDAHDALAAADGWGGGRYVSFTDDDERECVDVRFVGDSRADTDEIFDALTEWTAEGPDGVAEVTRAGDAVALLACDPGFDAPLLTGDAADAFALLATRVQLFELQLDEGLDADFAWCAADGFVRDAAVDDLNDDTGEYFASSRFFEQYEDAAAGCGLFDDALSAALSAS